MLAVPFSSLWQFSQDRTWAARILQGSKADQVAGGITLPTSEEGSDKAIAG